MVQVCASDIYTQGLYYEYLEIVSFYWNMDRVQVCASDIYTQGLYYEYLEIVSFYWNMDRGTGMC